MWRCLALTSSVWTRIVGGRLVPGVLEAPKRRTPRLPSGYRPHKFLQWLTRIFGRPKLKEHLAGVMALMRASPSWPAFQRDLKRAYPKADEQISLVLGDEK